MWVADGKSWSQRIWDNIERLTDTLNEQLIHIVATGKKNTELVNALQDRFNVSYHRANTLVRTEIAHIQTEAAKKRYQDYGVEKHNLNEISSQEIADVIVIAENELEQALNSLVFEANEQSERTTGIRKR